MTRSAPQRFDADPRAYAEYLRTPLGRLRSELSWRNLEPHLPRPGTLPPRALDLGAGTGEMDVASPEALLGEVRAALVDGGGVSLVVRNRSGEVMKRLLRAGDPDAAIGLLLADRVREDMYGLDVRLFDLAELRALARAAGLDPLVECGVRVVADYMPDGMLGGGGAFERMLEVEHRLGESPELRAVARYLQLIAARGDDSAAT